MAARKLESSLDFGVRRLVWDLFFFLLLARTHENVVQHKIAVILLKVIPFGSVHGVLLKCGFLTPLKAIWLKKTPKTCLLLRVEYM